MHPNKKLSNKNHRTVRFIDGLLALALIVSLCLNLAPGQVQRALAANPPPVQYYYVPFPDDYMMQHMEDIDDNNTTTNGDPYPPIRDIIAITISETGTYVYYDQWEDGGYDSDIANPGSNVYNASSNPDGTQIWGDGDLTNGCPPAIDNSLNLCTSAVNDQLTLGDVITLDNYTPLTIGSGDFHGSWIGSRSASIVRFDGKDKIGATAPIAASRAGWSVGSHTVSSTTYPATFSMYGDATAMDATDQWGTSYVTPVGKNSSMPNPYPFGYSHVEIMASQASTFVWADMDKDTVQDAGETATIGEGQIFDPSPNPNTCTTETNQCGIDAGVSITSDKPVQVLLITGAPGSTWATRWYNLLPRPRWTNDYLTPVGTNPATGAGCTSVWVYNPNGSSITVTQQTPGGSNSTSVASGGSTRLTPNTTYNIPQGEGARYSSTSVFYAVSVTDCEDATGQLYDWGFPLIATNDLTDQVVVGWAPGCSNESPDGICYDPGRDVTTSASRNVLWLTPLSNTTIYVDKNGTGITCPGGAGAEETQAATALTSYRFTNDPTSRAYVHDTFATQAYNRDDSVTGWPPGVIWTSDWTEGGGETGNSPTAGAIQINSTSDNLRLQELASTSESGRWIQRTHNTSGNTFARLSFRLSSYTGLDATDRIAIEVSTNGSTWVTLETYVGPWSGTSTEVLNISPYIANPTYIRFRFVDDLETSDYWAIDDVHIDYANGGDFDMTGSYARTCDGTKISAAYGENPQLSGSSDEEAPDLGTMIPPFRPPTVRTGAIGNYVWLDEDGDGVQDAGEAGIPNVKVTLTGTATDGTQYTLTTYTDANGGYLFSGIKPGSSYTVTVDPDHATTPTLPNGLYANPTYDENGTGTAHVTTLSLASGEEHMTADFGYNWAPTTDVSGNTNTGAIGDRVWIDSNGASGNGIQDPGEPGLAGVSVQLWYDANADGVIDTQYGSTATTDAAGYYYFDGLPAGIYEVRVTAGTTGYNQTGDPDDTLDAKTTAPIVLAPGDVYVNADFGYRSTGSTGTIGDTVWIDSNRNNTVDTGEPRLAGVTVALIKDSDGDGTWDAGEPIIATDITDESGQYAFSGLPIADGTGADDYLVWVNDSNNVLGELAPVYDVRDGASQGNPTTGVVTGLEISAVTNLDGTAVTNADFAYAPSGHDSTEGMIGDTIFLDRDAGNDFDPGEGLEGVQVELYNNTGQLLGRTTTNENGQYFFGGLAAGTYTVKVVTTTLPGGGANLTNTVDPDTASPGNSQSSVTIAGGGINLNQDFGYRPVSPQAANTISGTVWQDTNADGTLSGEAVRFQNVTVVLYADTNGNGALDGGDKVVGTTTTDGSGNYSFGNLPNGSYLVDVTDDNNVLNGLWKSNGPNAGADNNSQVDPYLVNVSGGVTNSTGDFGYYDIPAAVSNFVWNDVNGNGLQDGGEPGISGVEVILTVTYPNGAQVLLKTTTDGSGFYKFDNLLLDENFNGTTADGSTEPTFIINITPPAGYEFSPANVGANDAIDSDGNGTDVTVTEGQTNDTYDFGLMGSGTIGNVVWLDENGNGIQDVGEAGISNVTVELWNSNHTTLLDTTVTDAHGGYKFEGLLPGTYQVDVLNSSLPTGLVQSAIPGGTGDSINKADPYTITLAAGGEDLTADFGYNWAPATDITGNTNTGAIGDRVWIDADGDGIQDPEEAGLSGVTVQLWYDSNADGVIDAQYGGNVTTNATGNYIFDGLPAGIYEVRITAGTTGYNQTGDPDHYAATGANDAKTTKPIILGPGDVFVNADFGYQPVSNAGVIGDYVWFDANRDGLQAGEAGIPGVTVALVKDLNGNGVWDSGEPIIATDTTDAAGLYAFPGLPTTDGDGTDDYLVWVNDTDNVLGTMDPTFDRDGLGSPASGVVSGTDIAAVKDLAPGTTSDVDFGYTADGHKGGRGLIGDTIYIDRDGGNDLDTGEAVEGVTVELWNSTGTIKLATTITDENGAYYFGNLYPNATYRVIIPTSNFAAGAVLEGMNNTVDPDGGTANQSQVPLTTGSPINLSQDFGYRPSGTAGSISNQVWKDTDADGFKDAAETGIAGVTVDLYRDLNANGRIDPGEPKIGTTTTAGDGIYTFANLSTTGSGGGDAAAEYIVDITDTAGLLDGAWHSLGTANTNDNSQTDPYAVEISSASPNVVYADFGYFIEPAAIGNFIWQDNDEDGIQDATEPGIPNVTVILTISWPSGGTTLLKTVSDSNGYYEFGNLLLDENYDGVGSPEPSFSLKVDLTTLPSGFGPTKLGQGNGTNDSDNPAGAPATATRGAANINNNIDFGFDPFPTGVTVVDFMANYVSVNAVQIEWSAVDETDVAAYNIYRSGSPDMAQPVKVNAQPILVDLSGDLPHAYTYMDMDVATQTWYYWLAKIVTPNQNEVLMDDLPYATAVYRGVKMYLPITTK
jgi:protocatechuate 3,4-dioxygenase beta subunit